MLIIIDREFVDVSHTFYNEQEAKYFVFTRSTDGTEYNISSEFPLSKDYVRGHVHYNGYSFSEYDGGKSTRLIQINQVDIKGNIPGFIVNKVAPQGMFDFVKAMYEHLSGNK